jgi:hypothetical protein
MESKLKFKLAPVSCIQYFDWKTLKDWKLAVAKEHFVILYVESLEEESKQSLSGIAFLVSLCINVASKRQHNGMPDNSFEPFILKYLSKEEYTELNSILRKFKSPFDVIEFFRLKRLQNNLSNLSNKLFSEGIPDDIHEAAKQFLKQIPDARISIYDSKAELIVYGDSSNYNYDIEVACVNSHVGVLLKNAISTNIYLDLYIPETYTWFFTTLENAINAIEQICPSFVPMTNFVYGYNDIKQIMKNHYENEMKKYNAKDLYKKLCDKFGGYEKLNIQYTEMIMEIEAEHIRQLYSE